MKQRLVVSSKQTCGLSQNDGVDHARQLKSKVDSYAGADAVTTTVTVTSPWFQREDAWGEANAGLSCLL